MWRSKGNSVTLTDSSVKASTLSPKYVLMKSCHKHSQYWCQGSRQASWSLCPVSRCCLYGLLDSEGQFTGDNIAWVYPDNKTALLGRLAIEEDCRLLSCFQENSWMDKWWRQVQLLWGIETQHLITHRISFYDDEVTYSPLMQQVWR